MKVIANINIKNFNDIQICIPFEQKNQQSFCSTNKKQAYKSKIELVYHIKNYYLEKVNKLYLTAIKFVY